MTKSSLARITLFLAIAAAVTAMVRLWPSEEDRLKAVILKARNAVSSENRPNTPVDALARVGELTGCLTRDIVVEVDVFGLGAGKLSGIDEVRAAALAIPQQFPGLKVQIAEIQVGLDGPDAAHGSFVATTSTGAGRGGAQEFNVRFRRFEGRWYLSRIETVRTLHQR